MVNRGRGHRRHAPCVLTEGIFQLPENLVQLGEFWRGDSFSAKFSDPIF